MYYFLGMKLWMSDLKIKKKQLRAENTFVLALDGDVDFHPEALQMLVDLMKKDPKVGAACGRIHPIGNGNSTLLPFFITIMTAKHIHLFCYWFCLLHCN